MDVWVTFLPGSAGSTFEMVLRCSTNLPVLVPKVDYRTCLVQDASGNLTAHAFPRQWHAPDYAEMTTTGKQKGPTDTTVYSIISPTLDAEADKIFKWVHDNSESTDRHVYLGPRDPVFGLVTQQKIRNISASFSPNARVKEWNPDATTFQDLARWQKREYLSEYLQYFFDLVEEQHRLAQHYGWITAYSEDIFNNTHATFTKLIKQLGGEINDQLAFNTICGKWQHNQASVHSGYKQITDYIKAIETDDLNTDLPLQSLLYEAIIQRYLKVEKHQLLKCYDLNTFPRTVRELKEYYE